MSEDPNYIDLDEAERLDQLQQKSLNDNDRVDDEWPEPLPLTRPLGNPRDYPAEALGPVLGNAARGIASVVQCPLAIAGSSVLAVASLAAQAHVDVVHPAIGRRIPVSLSFLTIAASGERKSAADAMAIAPVRQHETVLAERYKGEYGRWRNAHEAWEASRATLKRKAKGDWKVLERDLQALGDEPKPPPHPHVVVTDPTYEGLAKLMAVSQPSLGLFSPEGGGFLGGHAMREENRLRALTGLSELWDGTPLKRTRAGDGAMHLAGRRLTLHLMVQPNIAPMLLADDLAVGQGFLSRLLVSAPGSLQGTRLQRDPEPWVKPTLELYNETIFEMLIREPRVVGDNELDPLTLALSEQALHRWRRYADVTERGLVAAESTPGTRGLRNKLPEMALRIAGLLTCVEGGHEITTETLERAIVIAEFYLSEATRLYEASMTSPPISRASKLLKWLVENGHDRISLRDIQTFGPSNLREADIVRQTVNILVEHGLCRVETKAGAGRKSKVLVLSPYAKDAV